MTFRPVLPMLGPTALGRDGVAVRHRHLKFQENKTQGRRDVLCSWSSILRFYVSIEIGQSIQKRKSLGMTAGAGLLRPLHVTVRLRAALPSSRFARVLWDSGSGGRGKAKCQ